MAAEADATTKAVAISVVENAAVDATAKAVDLAAAIVRVVKGCALRVDLAEPLAKVENPVAINAVGGRPVAQDRVARDPAKARSLFNVWVSPLNRLLQERRSSR